MRFNYINFAQDLHLTPIPVKDDLPNLSAILMDESNNYTIDHSRVEDGVHLANIDSLIVLKARAYIDLRTSKDKGRNVDAKKHSAKEDSLTLCCCLWYYLSDSSNKYMRITSYSSI